MTDMTKKLATGFGLLLASSALQASNTGTDTNLSAKARAGGMGGAAYTMPQEASAAVFGNPATLTQFKGVNVNFGTSLLAISSADIETSSKINALGGSVTSRSHSDADNYVIPDFGLSIQLSPNLVIGTGLEVDAGIGADYRDDPISLTGAGLITLPLNVELISFNANLAAAYQTTERLSIGAALTVGYAMVQLGTAGPTSGLSNVLGANATGTPFVADGGANLGINDFGGTTSSVHDIGFGASLGAIYQLDEGIALSLTAKSEVQYNLNNILYQDTLGFAFGGSAGSYQNLKLEQPAEIIAGIAINDVFAPGLLVEADIVWKNWSEAATYQDIFDDQFMFLLGAQYRYHDWTFRAGYSFVENMIKNKPSNTLGDFAGLGSLPMGETGGAPFGNDLTKIAQASLLPIIWKHTITAGIGYALTDAVSIDAYAAYAFPEEESTPLTNIEAAVSAHVLPTTDLKIKSSIDAGYLLGAGLTISLP